MAFFPFVYMAIGGYNVGNAIMDAKLQVSSRDY